MLLDWKQETLRRFASLAKQGHIRLVTPKHGGIFLRKISQNREDQTVRVLVLRCRKDFGGWVAEEENVIPREDWEGLKEQTDAFFSKTREQG